MPSGRSAEGGQPSAGVRGVPENPLFFLFARRLRRRKRKRGFWGHPRPRQGETCTPFTRVHQLREHYLEEDEKKKLQFFLFILFKKTGQRDFFTPKNPACLIPAKRPHLK